MKSTNLLEHTVSLSYLLQHLTIWARARICVSAVCTLCALSQCSYFPPTNQVIDHIRKRYIENDTTKYVYTSTHWVPHSICLICWQIFHICIQHVEQLNYFLNAKSDNKNYNIEYILENMYNFFQKTTHSAVAL